MADFRRLFYALALVALLAGLTVPVSAQAPPFQCSAATSVPPTIRVEGWTELVGDLILTCQGGVPTPAGQVVPPVNITVNVNTYLTSRLLFGGLWSEALVIIDEPHSAANTTRQILNCGNAGAADSGPSGPNVCGIIATSDPSHTYDGVANGYSGSGVGSAFSTGTCTGTGGLPTANTYTCGRPNVFQGRLGTPQDPAQYTSMSWLGVPLDPPGTTTTRTIRITNIRVDAHDLGIPAPGNFNLQNATMQISINGNTSLSINNSQQTVAFVATGLIAGISHANTSFLQCVGENPFSAPPFGTLSGTFPVTGSQTNGTSPRFTFTEGFGSSWKAKNISFITNSTMSGYTGNGTVVSTASYWSYDGFGSTAAPAANGTINYPKDFNQNVPGAIYNTESGFMNPSGAATLDSGALDPQGGLTNPPFGVGTVTVNAGLGGTFHNSTLIDNAGIADQGTRLQVQISNIPTGAFVMIPTAIYLTNCSVGTCNSGIAVLTNTDAAGAGVFASLAAAGATAPAATTSYVPLPATGMAVYEVLFADPFSIESATMTAIVAYSPNLNVAPNGNPVPNSFATAFGGFAPFYTSAAAREPQPLPFPSGVNLPVPRFYPSSIPTNTNFFEVSKCACDMLFPYVVTAAGYDTGIAIANTSQDNLGIASGSAALQQQGAVTFWFYGQGNNGGIAPPSETTTANVPAGQILTYELALGASNITGANGGVSGGLNPEPGFQGYVIAQAQFQYCHAYAFITAIGAGPTAQAVSEGYLGLILDNGSWNCNSVSKTAGLCRTGQSAENLVH